MIKKASNRSIIQKLMLCIICIMLIVNFTIPNYSHADIANSLFKPIKGLVCAIGDSVMSLLQACFIGEFRGVTSEEGTTGNKERWGTVLWVAEDKVEWPTILITPEEIFQGKIPALNVNFIKEIQDWATLTAGGKQPEDVLSTEKTQNSLISLRNTISNWYMALRNISIIGLLSILVYIGIRMMLCSIASEKAKYKQMLMDWIVALCLIFFLHYIMSLTMTVVEQITGIFTDSSVESIGLMEGDTITVNGETKTAVSNLMEYARVYVSLADAAQSCAYLIIYVWLIVYTVRFIIVYVKRFIHMAFLTLIAPLVALTYPLDKISDGKAQAFNLWLKDYIFNALIQPFHLIVYTVFVSSAMEFATNNLIYACVAIGFIIPAEKFMRKMFGFDKAPNPPGGLGSFAGGAVAGNLLSKATSAIGKGGNGGKEGSNDAPKPPKTTTKTNAYVGDGNSSGGSSSSDSGSRSGSNSESGTGSTDSPNGNQGELPEGSTGGAGEGQGGASTDLTSPDVQQQLETGEEREEETREDQAGAGGTNPDRTSDNGTTPTGEQSQAATRNTPRARRTSTHQNNGERRKITGFKNGVKGVFKAAAPIVGKTLKTGLKVAGGAAGAGISGLVALAQGKDAGDIVKSMAAGAGVGVGLGAAAGKLPSRIGEAGRGIKRSVGDARANYVSVTDKDRADEMRYRNNYMNDKSRRDYVKKYFKNQNGGALSGKEVQKKMEQLYDLERAGITDVETQQKLMDFEDEKYTKMEQRSGQNWSKEEQENNRQMARQRAIYAYEAAKEYKKTDLMDKSEKIKSDLAGTIMEENAGVNQVQANTIAQEVFDDVATMKGVSRTAIRQGEQKAAQRKIEEAQQVEQARREQQEDREQQRRMTAALERMAGITNDN